VYSFPPTFSISVNVLVSKGCTDKWRTEAIVSMVHTGTLPHSYKLLAKASVLIQFNSIYFSSRLKAHDTNSYTVKYI